MSIRHAHQTAIVNDPTKDVSATHWNADHTLPEPLEVLPDTAGHDDGELLTLSIVGDSPTLTDLIALRPALLAMGWSASHNYQTAQGQSDVVQWLKPSGSANVFIAEVTGSTGGSEPNWAAAPNPGNSVSDGAVTWYNQMPYASFPPTPTTWNDGTAYATGDLVWPLVPNGHVYAAYPTGLTSGGVEPDFGSITQSQFIADGTGYWMDCGDSGVGLATAALWASLSGVVLTAPAVANDVTPTADVSALILRDAGSGSNDSTVLQVHASDGTPYAFQVFNETADPGPGFSLYVADGGDAFILADLGAFHFNAASKPNLPASPSAQDIADALKTLGLVTQS